MAALPVGEGRATLPVSVTGKVFILHVGLFRICAFGCDKRPHVTGANVSSSSGLKPFIQTAAGGVVCPARSGSSPAEAHVPATLLNHWFPHKKGEKWNKYRLTDLFNVFYFLLKMYIFYDLFLDPYPQ